MRSIISGLVGGLVAAMLTAYIAKRIGKASTPGTLKFGPVLWVIGACCLAFAVFVAMTFFAERDKDVWARVALIAGFGAGAIYCFAEAVFTRGRYDENGITFSTPWTGSKQEKWPDLVSITLNEWASWYTLTFRNGNTIRLSRYLSGHLSALEMASAQSELELELES
jgi:hypothetical protein